MPERATRKRSEKSAEVVVAASDRGEGPNGEEGETIVSLGSARPQKARQLELPLEDRGGTPNVERSAEARTATHGNERSGASDLMERVCERANLQAALKRVRKNKGSAGIDGMTVEELPEYLRTHWPRLREQLLTGRYQPSAVRRHTIPKSGGGVRVLGIPTVVDRFLQQAILQVLSPRFDASFSQHSYGFRPGRSAHDAVVQAQQYVNEGRRIVVDVDLENFFDRVNHDVLMGRLAKRIEDGRLLGLVRRYLEAGMMANGVAVQRHEGTPQGGPLSPLLKNYFRLADTPRIFRELDKWIRHRLRALHLKHWKRGRTIYRELRARGLSEHTAAQVAANGRRWWKNSAIPSARAIHIAFPIRSFDELGIPRLAA